MFDGLTREQLEEFFDLEASEYTADNADTPTGDPTCGVCLCCYGGCGCCD
ncbi:MAG: hypothetical protein ACRD2C_20360 [Acidimicrobiales bacterium]